MTFEKQVTAWSRKSESRMEAVFKTAVQDMIEDAQLPVDKGGRMRVDTGFLRNSGVAGINKIPEGSSDPANMAKVALIINKAKIGDTIYFGWTANYARYRESKDAFMRMAAQKWGRFVKVAARRIKQSGSSLKND